MKHNQATFQGAGSLDLYYQSWRADGVPRAVLVIIHGAGDHSGRFERLVLPLAAQGFTAYAFDLRGFGRSPGKKGHINSWNEYREDVRLFLELVGNMEPGIPVFLFGYSLGAVIVLEYVLRSPQGLRGAILSGTPIAPVGVAPAWQVALARLMSRIWPGFTIRRISDLHGVSRDPAVLAALQADPLHHDLVTARWGTEAMSVMESLRGQAAQVRLPLLLLHGGDDPFNLASGVQRYYDQVAFPDKVLRIYPGSRHETHNDLDNARVAADVIAWMGEHVAQE